jgi:hypothetical protein
MKNNIRKPKTSEEITGIARTIIYRIGTEDQIEKWLEHELTRLYYDGVMLGREQSQLSNINSSQRV